MQLLTLDNKIGLGAMDKQIYIDDLLNRFAGYSFEETKENNLYTVVFLNLSEKIASATRMDILDCYRNIRENVLSDDKPQFRLTTAQIDNLDTIQIEPGITVLNLDKDMSVSWNGTEWVTVAGKGTTT